MENKGKEIYNAVEQNKLQRLTELLESGASEEDINYQDKYGSTALLRAIEVWHRYPEVAILLLNYGADPNIPKDNGLTPVLAAINRELIILLPLLLEKGADIDYQSPHGFTALISEACKTSNKEENNITSLFILEFLIENGADLNLAASQMTALMWAAGLGKHQAVRRLLDAGASITQINEHGNSAIDLGVGKKIASCEVIACLQKLKTDKEKAIELLALAFDHNIEDTCKVLNDFIADKYKKELPCEDREYVFNTLYELVLHKHLPEIVVVLSKPKVDQPHFCQQLAFTLYHEVGVGAMDQGFLLFPPIDQRNNLRHWALVLYALADDDYSTKMFVMMLAKVLRGEKSKDQPSLKLKDVIDDMTVESKTALARFFIVELKKYPSKDIKNVINIICAKIGLTLDELLPKNLPESHKDLSTKKGK